MKLADTLLEISNNRNTLLYNSYTNTMCIVPNNLYNTLKQEKGSVWAESISNIDIRKLINNGIIIDSISNYESKNYSTKCMEQYECRKNLHIEVVYFHVTQRCNLQCSYCYNKSNLNKKQELSTQVIFETINKLKRNGVETIVLTGGEALLRDDIISICHFAKKEGLKIELLTNGTLLNEKRQIINYVDSVIVSLDTLNPDENVRKGLNIDELLQVLRNFDEKERNKVSIRSVISRRNENSYNSVRLFCAENGYRFLPALYIPNSMEDVKNMPLTLNIQKGTEIKLPNKIGARYCGAGCSKIAIDSDGSIYPCQMLIREHFKLGSIYNNFFTLRDIHQFTDRKVTHIEGCKECQYKYLCGGGCPAVSYYLFGKMDIAPKPVCKYLKEEIRDVLREVLRLYE